MTGLMALDLGRALKALLPLIVAGTAITAVAGALGAYDAVVYVGCILLLAIPAAMISQIMYLQEERCGWMTFVVSSGQGRGRVVCSRFMAAVLIPSAAVGIASCIAGLASGAHSLVMMVLMPASLCASLSSIASVSYFVGDWRVGKAFVYAISVVCVFVLFLAMVGFQSIDGGDTSLTVFTICSAVAICAAGYAVSRHGFEAKDL